MSAPEPRFQLTQLTQRPAVKCDRGIGELHVLRAHGLAAR